MKSKRTNPLWKLLFVLLAILLVGIPTILALLDGDLLGIAWPMGILGLWLVLFGRLKVGRLSMEGKQAFSVGGALLFPLGVSILIQQFGLWPPLLMGSILVGLVAGVILFFAVKPTPVPKDRTVLVAVFLGGLVVAIIGNVLAPSDSAGTILVNGIPFLHLSSISGFLQVVGLAAVFVGVIGLIFGFKHKK